jgi:hypothetical protein
MLLRSRKVRNCRSCHGRALCVQKKAGVARTADRWLRWLNGTVTQTLTSSDRATPDQVYLYWCAQYSGVTSKDRKRLTEDQT